MPFTYRMLWTWDRWICRPTRESFVGSYRTLIDSMAAAGLNGLVIWGLLDTRHGGVAAAHEVCEYGARRGVRVLPGVGLYSYGGVYCRGRHEFNIETCLRRHPERTAQRSPDALFQHPEDVPLPEEVPRGALCPRHPENRRWMAAAVRWLGATLPIGGVCFETGDNARCECVACARARGQDAGREFSFGDMAGVLPDFCRLVRQALPDAWVTYATYSDYRRLPAAAADHLRDLPAEAVAHWNVVPFHGLYQRSAATLPTARNIAFCKYVGGTHFNIPFTPVYPEFSYRGVHPFLDSLARFCATAQAEGMEGVMMQATGLPTMPDNELNYLAFGEFARQPGTTPLDVVARLYGAPAAAPVAAVLSRIEAVDERVRYWFFTLAGLFARPSGHLGGRWRARPDLEAAAAPAELAALAATFAEALAVIQALPPNGATTGRRRRLACLLREQHALFAEFFPRLLPVYRRDQDARRLLTDATVRRCRQAPGHARLEKLLATAETVPDYFDLVSRQLLGRTEPDESTRRQVLAIRKDCLAQLAEVLDQCRQLPINRTVFAFDRALANYRRLISGSA